MDYEKKYNEAMLRADEAVQKGCLDKDMFDIIFPPDESEDERIRKWLYDYFSSIKATVWIHWDITCEQILEWLEKQKEQKPAWSEADERNARYLENLCDTEILRGSSTRSEYEVKCDAKEWLASLREKFNFQAKMEWSEEDKQWLSEVYFAIDHSMYSDEEKRAMKKYIDSLRPGWKPSEEQMEALQRAIDACESEWDYQDDELRSLLNDIKKL